MNNRHKLLPPTWSQEELLIIDEFLLGMFGQQARIDYIYAQTAFYIYIHGATQANSTHNWQLRFNAQECQDKTLFAEQFLQQITLLAFDMLYSLKKYLPKSFKVKDFRCEPFPNWLQVTDQNMSINWDQFKQSLAPKTPPSLLASAMQLFSAPRLTISHSGIEVISFTELCQKLNKPLYKIY